MTFQHFLFYIHKHAGPTHKMLFTMDLFYDYEIVFKPDLMSAALFTNNITHLLTLRLRRKRCLHGLYWNHMHCVQHTENITVVVWFSGKVKTTPLVDLYDTKCAKFCNFYETVKEYL